MNIPKPRCSDIAESSSLTVPLNIFDRKPANAFSGRRLADSGKDRCSGQPINTRLIKPQPMNMVKPSSCPKAFLGRFSAHQEEGHHAEHSDFFVGQDSDEDTESFFSSGDSDDNHLSNEVQERNEADEELATLFGSDDICQPIPFNSRKSAFQRPLNPIIYDRKFTMARCSAPSAGEPSLYCPFAKAKSEGYTFAPQFVMTSE